MMIFGLVVGAAFALLAGASAAWFCAAAGMDPMHAGYAVVGTVFACGAVTAGRWALARSLH
jgi:hypothetical protein